MNAENQKVDGPDESQNPKQTADNSRRSFAKAGMIAPVVMTLASKSALGSIYHCTTSGAQSGNHSSPHDNTTPCAVGVSPGGWWQNASKLKGDPDGGLDDWCYIKIVPFTTAKISGVDKIKYRGVWYSSTSSSLAGCDSWSNLITYIKNQQMFGQQAKTFGSIFGGSDSRTLWDVLDQTSGNDLKRSAVTDYLNALLYESGYSALQASLAPVYSAVTSDDIVALYKLATGQYSFPYTLPSGQTITSTFNSGNGGVAGYLFSIHP